MTQNSPCTTSTKENEPQDRITTAQEFLDDQAELLKEASEVYSKSIDSCSYAKGYVKQQIFSCRTCASLISDGSPIGVCYGCVVSCHTDHDIVELELRRQFRCDCGTTKIPQNQCMLKKGLYEASTENRYNHNFQGKFCHCESDYIPELEERTLIQCLICEDWIHDTCILKERQPQLPDEFDDYICRNCAETHPFLYNYQGITAFDFSAKEFNENPSKRPHDPFCKLKLHTNKKLLSKGDIFLLTSWRDQLCSCDSCNNMYNSKGLSYLSKEEEIFEPKDDPVASSDPFDLASRALMTVDRVHAINGIRVFTGLKDDLMNYLRSFADEGKVVTSQDITQFFLEKEEQRYVKRQRRS